MRALRLRPEDSCRVSFACCYTYAGLGFCLMKCSRMQGAAAEISESWHPASGIWHLANLPLLSHNNNTMPLRIFTRRHYNIIMFWRLGGQFVVVGGWLVQAQGTPQNSKNTFAYYTRMSY